jgi:hypothetical protein
MRRTEMKESVSAWLGKIFKGKIGQVEVTMVVSKEIDISSKGSPSLSTYLSLSLYLYFSISPLSLIYN